MRSWQPRDEQKKQYEDEGYFIVRGVIPRDTALETRGVIKNHILSPDLEVQRQEMDPMDPMGDSPAARTARLRKLANFCAQAPLIWHNIHAGEPLLRIARYFLGQNILCKYNSCFLKPPRTGSATPWHQDNGLWRDGETSPFNFWMAIDPATRTNGCMQFIPGSHKGDIITHLLYPDSTVHAELPRERVREAKEKNGLHHIEMEPGDVVFWHSSLYHYSPPNTSEQGRIAVAGVWSTPQIAWQRPFPLRYHWCMKNGQICETFPPKAETWGDLDGQPAPIPRIEVEASEAAMV